MAQAPARDAFQVLDWIMSRHVHEYLDVAGRPVGEGRAAAFRHVPTEMQSCPYAGSRHHHAKSMNVSALRQILPVWEQVLTMLSWLSRRYRARQRREVTTFEDLSLVTSAGAFLADFLVLRRHQPLRSGEIPVLISGLYKVCLGFQLATFLGALQERFAGAAAAPLPDAAAFYAGLEEQELLIGEAEVCSGSAAMIMQAYDAIAGQHAAAPETRPPPCAGLAIAWERADVFTDHAAELWNDLVLYVIRAAQFCPKLTDPRLPPDVRRRLNDCLDRRASQLMAGQAGLVVDLARAGRDYCGRATSWHPEPAAPPSPRPSPRPGSLAATVMAWLSEVGGADVQTHAPVVASDLRSQLDRYEVYEATVLADINQHLSRLMDALGLGQPGGELTASALSHVCRRTLRDWDDPSRDARRPEARRR
jgi:hypothetical protein